MTMSGSGAGRSRGGKTIRHKATGMALLLDIRDPLWMKEEDLRDFLTPLLPGTRIRTKSSDRVDPDVIMLATVKLHPGLVATLPNLKLVQKLGAGVDGIVRDPDLPTHVRVTRLRPDTPAQEIAEYCVAYVLRDQRNLLFHAAKAANHSWKQIAPRRSPDTTVGVLGLGHIGARTARYFSSLGFRVLGWSRSEKRIEGVECRHGDEALREILPFCDYVASVLPSTARTGDLFDADRFAIMKPGAVLINVGRGTVVDEPALARALMDGELAGAVLDVFQQEPLSQDSSLWNAPGLMVTGHVAAHSRPADIAVIFRENYRRYCAGETLEYLIDFERGY